MERAISQILKGQRSDEDPEIDYDEYEAAQRLHTEGIKIMNSLCMNTKLPVIERYNTLKKLIELEPEYGYDMLSRYRDALTHLTGDEIQAIIQILIMIIKDTTIDSHERTFTCVTLFNTGEIDICYDCFSTLAYDKSLLVKYRVEACKYLFGSWDDECREEALDVLREIINTTSLQSIFRYRVIAGYISNTGIGTLLNNNKIKIGYSEPFVYELQKVFFFNKENGVRERILSGQHLLQMEIITDEEMAEVSDDLLQIVLNEEHTIRTRADACDVLIREGKGDAQKIAGETLDKIRFKDVDSEKSGFDRIRTFYNDAENAHKVLPEVLVSLEGLYTEFSTTKLRPYSDIHSRVVKLIKENISEREKRVTAFNALNRIDIDTARFTTHSLTIADVLILVLMKIETYPHEERETYYRDLLYQLEEMDDTCSSGHIGRLVQIVAPIKVSWSDQVLSNYKGRLEAKVAKLSDDNDIKGLISCIAIGISEKERTQVTEFVDTQFEVVKDELYKEFVTEDYISNSDFDLYSIKAKHEIYRAFGI